MKILFIFLKDRKTDPFHGQILAAPEIMTKEKISEARNRNCIVLRKERRGNALMVYLKDWQEEE